jgi:hypothetical protein
MGLNPPPKINPSIDAPQALFNVLPNNTHENKGLDSYAIEMGMIYMLRWSGNEDFCACNGNGNGIVIATQ